MGVRLCALAALVPCLVLPHVISLTYDAHSPADRPNVADWMQAWGNLAAVGAGLLAALAARSLLRHEIATTRRNEEPAHLSRLVLQPGIVITAR